jgi:E3 ubiquitin-protein ligase mind-bomb
MEPVLGLRVVRGPDWEYEWGDQDGGEGFVGTVTGLEEGGGAVTVQWDMGYKSRYRCGQEDKFDLRVLDSAQIGTKHTSVQCACCGVGIIWGFLWRCVRCLEVSLCSQCYATGGHSTLHPFMRVDTDQGKTREKVPPRDSSSTGVLSGVFPGAVVVRGVDWKWGDQDGKEGNCGHVKGIKDWNENARSTVEVLWKDKRNAKNYRLGHKGKVDVKCVTPAFGGVYYPTHLPILGGEPRVHCEDLAAGDNVKVELDPDVWKRMQQGHGEWNDRMAEFIGTTGVIQHISDSGDLLVSYPGNALFHINPEAVMKVDVRVYKIGDVVSVNSDRGEVSKMQKGHGDWVEDMIESLGQPGKVVKVLPSGDVQVAVKGRRWVFSPSCLQPAPGEQPQLEANEVHLSSLVKAQLKSLIEQSSAEVVVAASAAGDVDTVRAFLQDRPKEVNVKVQNKTGLMVATAEGYLNVVTTLLDLNASVNEQDEDGETALHYCAHLNRNEIAEKLLAHNADPNACNHVGVFPILIATALGNYSVLKVLLASDQLNHCMQDIDGNTALHMAVVSHRSEAVKLLLMAGAVPTIANHNHFTPILEAARNGFYAGLEQFMKTFPDEVNYCKIDDGHSALHIAAANNHLDMVCLLAAMENCNLNATNAMALQTPLHLAAQEGYTRVIERLIGYGADPNMTDVSGNTPLSDVIRNRGIIKTPSEDSPQTLQINQELTANNGGAALDNYVAVACLLVREGASFSQEVLQTAGCPVQVTSLIVSYAGRRGSYHGSLKHSSPAH